MFYDDDDDAVSMKNRASIRKETYRIVKDYSEYSTIQGVIYLFQSGQTQCGKLFWSLVVLAMLILGTYWSGTAYNDWVTNPVLTTVKTSALKIKNIDFPAITICGQGVYANILQAGWFKVFYNYTRQLNISFGMSPIRTVKVQTKGSSDQVELEKALRIMNMLINDSSNILGGFLDLHMPGFTVKDPLDQTSPIFASRNPDEFIKVSKLFNLTHMDTCQVSGNPGSGNCTLGFAFDPIGGNCFLALNETRNYWAASGDACSSFGAKLVSFDNDSKVQGFIKLINSGKGTFLTTSFISIIVYFNFLVTILNMKVGTMLFNTVKCKVCFHNTI